MDCYFAASSAGAGDTKMKSSIDFWLSAWKQFGNPWKTEYWLNVFLVLVRIIQILLNNWINLLIFLQQTSRFVNVVLNFNLKIMFWNNFGFTFVSVDSWNINFPHLCQLHQVVGELIINQKSIGIMRMSALIWISNSKFDIKSFSKKSVDTV